MTWSSKTDQLKQANLSIDLANHLFVCVLTDKIKYQHTPSANENRVM